MTSEVPLDAKFYFPQLEIDFVLQSGSRLLDSHQHRGEKRSLENWGSKNINTQLQPITLLLGMADTVSRG